MLVVAKVEEIGAELGYVELNLLWVLFVKHIQLGEHLVLLISSIKRE
jgi:hypothetical protein